MNNHGKPGNAHQPLRGMKTDAYGAPGIRGYLMCIFLPCVILGYVIAAIHGRRPNRRWKKKYGQKRPTPRPCKPQIVMPLKDP